jgi:hypothetical protein
MRGGIAVGMFVLAAFLALPARAADDMGGLSNGEICVRHDITLILGESFDGNSEQEQAAELARRGEGCEPSSFYLQIAAKRVEAMRQALAEQQAQQEQEALVAQQQQAAQGRTWGQRIHDAANAYLQMQQQQEQQRQSQQPQRPTQTTCHDTTVGMQCTTW